MIDQCQFVGDESVSIGPTAKSANIRLSFNHPCKSLAWVTCGPQHGQWTGGPVGTYAGAYAPLDTAKLLLNGHERFASRRGSYFNQVQPYQSVGTQPRAGVSLYSFALRPAEHQPSGTCNMSRIDNSTLQLTFKAAPTNVTTFAGITDESTTVAAATNLTALRVFAVNYNILSVVNYNSSRRCAGSKAVRPRNGGILGENGRRTPTGRSRARAGAFAASPCACWSTWATLPNCGNTLKPQVPPTRRKVLRGTRLTAGHNGKNPEDVTMGNPQLCPYTRHGKRARLRAPRAWGKFRDQVTAGQRGASHPSMKAQGMIRPVPKGTGYKMLAHHVWHKPPVPNSRLPAKFHGYTLRGKQWKAMASI